MKDVKRFVIHPLHALHVLYGFLLLVLLSVATPAAQAPPVTATTALAVSRWVDAVRDHTSGQIDDALISIGKMTVEDRAQLTAGLPLFRSGLTQQPARISLAAQKRILDLGHDIARDPGVTVFVERAIMLHGDAAIASAQHPELAVGGGPVAGQQLLERDGEIVGATGSNWNWPFARAMVALQPTNRGTPFVAEWFHVTTAFLMSRRLFGEARTHLLAAATVLPGDARILFDRAAFAEMQGLPESQVLLTTEDLAAMRARRGPVMRNTLIRPSDTAERSGVRPAEVENAEAERLYRSALAAAPAMVEARVRLARLLDVRGRHDEAADELARALADRVTPAPAVVYFANLAAGRVDRALGQLESAAAHFQSALTLFPNAQAALLGASHVAVLRADVEGALAAVRQLEVANATADRRMDPWWSYSIGAGRDADALLRELWVRARSR